MEDFDKLNSLGIARNNSSPIFHALARLLAANLQCSRKETILLLNIITLTAGMLVYRMGTEQLSDRQKQDMTTQRIEAQLAKLLSGQAAMVIEELIPAVENGVSDKAKAHLATLRLMRSRLTP